MSQSAYHLSPPLSGADAARLVAYIDEPTPPGGHLRHAAFLASADQVFRESRELTLQALQDGVRSDILPDPPEEGPKPRP